MEDNDPKWSQLIGGYNVLYNPIAVLKGLSERPLDKALWDELWLNLHHQGDIGIASYVAVVYLMKLRQAEVAFDWNFYALLATIEIQRHKNSNPVLPEWLVSDYQAAWATIKVFCVEDMSQAKNAGELRVYLSIIALAKGQLALGDLLITIDDEQIQGFLAGEMGW